MEVKILAIRILPEGRGLKAFADVLVNGWVVHDFRILKQDGQRAFVSSPQVSWKDPITNQIKYKGILTIPPEQKQCIEVEVLAAYQKEMEKRMKEVFPDADK